ncbi:MAG: hypothetical protein GF353_19305 [Candidatus Lokiarchaeota archaeon]|nr:hypothetical protein [Candidatus Lokiarchaeota archaeon]
MSNNEHSWAVKLNWLNILRILQLRSIKQIAEYKRDKAISRLTKTYGMEVLLDLECDELDRLVAEELKELMKKELSAREKHRQKMKEKMKSSVIPFKRGGIIKIDPRDFKDLDQNADPEDILKQLAKKFLGDEDEDNDDDKEKFREDKNGYYI